MVCEQIGTEFDAYALANRVLEVVQAPFTIAGNEVVVTASIGITMVSDSPPEEVLRDADAAMYWAKERGRARAEVFDEELRERVVTRLDIESRAPAGGRRRCVRAALPADRVARRATR